MAVPVFIFTFCVTFAVWLALSGRFDIFHLGMGVVSCAIVSFFSSDLLLQSPRFRRLPMVWLRFIGFIPWLLYQVLMANLYVLVLAFHPKMREKIDPRITRFKSRLKSDIALVTLANSITLTPGTITVYISVYGEVTVHMIDLQSGQSLPGMDAKIAEIFGE
jgi:multicomponent Na+:H+ antiporter subunit E